MSELDQTDKDVRFSRLPTNTLPLKVRIEAHIKDLKANLEKQLLILELLQRNPDAERILELMR